MNQKTFFISYTTRTKRDVQWAKWAEWVLRVELGHKTIMQEYDFRPGDNFRKLMDDALKEADCVIGVLTHTYMTSSNCTDEWTNADQFIPIRFDDCHPKGLLKCRVYIDLNKRDREAAKEELIAKLQGTVRPTKEPDFPDLAVIPAKKSAEPFFPAFPSKKLEKKKPHFKGSEEELEQIQDALAKQNDSSEMKHISKEIKIKRILVLSANPKNTTQLRLPEEARNIKNSLKRSQNREAFHIEYSPATRTDDIRQEMLDFRPHIVHFCGHGAGENGIVFEDASGNAVCVTADTLAGFFRLFQDTLECVVLNACYSEIQANEIAKHISYVIGMNESIGDNIAIKFSDAYYDAVFANEAYDFAYELAHNAIKWGDDVPQSLFPVLIKHGVPIKNVRNYDDAPNKASKVYEKIRSLFPNDVELHAFAEKMLDVNTNELVCAGKKMSESDLNREVAKILMDFAKKTLDSHDPSEKTQCYLCEAVNLLENGDSSNAELLSECVKLKVGFYKKQNVAGNKLMAELLAQETG